MQLIKYSPRIIARILVIVVYFMVFAYSCAVAQPFRPLTHFGVEAAFGLHGISAKNNRLAGSSSGGSLGFVTGNNLLKARFRLLGFYKSLDQDQRTVQRNESEVLLNFYPLEFFRTRSNVLDIYITAGVGVNHFKFERNVNSDYLRSTDTGEFSMLDKAKVVAQTSGLGIEYHVPSGNRFIHLFAEAAISQSLSSSTDNVNFRNHWRDSKTSLNFGIRFGSTKNAKVYDGQDESKKN
jgi:hypothetical protein